jgi:hypothetical protein
VILPLRLRPVAARRDAHNVRAPASNGSGRKAAR